MLFSCGCSEDSTQVELLFQAMENFDNYNVSKILNSVTWHADAVQELQKAILDVPQLSTCYPYNLEDFVSAKMSHIYMHVRNVLTYFPFFKLAGPRKPYRIYSRSKLS